MMGEACTLVLFIEVVSAKVVLIDVDWSVMGAHGSGYWIEALRGGGE